MYVALRSTSLSPQIQINIDSRCCTYAYGREVRRRRLCTERRRHTAGNCRRNDNWTDTGTDSSCTTLPTSAAVIITSCITTTTIIIIIIIITIIRHATKWAAGLICGTDLNGDSLRICGLWIVITVGLGLGFRIYGTTLLEKVTKCGSITWLKLTNGDPPRRSAPLCIIVVSPIIHTYIHIT